MPEAILDYAELNWNLVSEKNWLRVSKPLLHRIGIKETLLLNELITLDHYNRKRENYNGWFPASMKVLYKHTSIPEDSQRRSIDRLVEMDLLKKKRFGLPARNWYLINHKAFNELLLKGFPEDVFAKHKNSTQQIAGSSPRDLLGHYNNDLDNKDKDISLNINTTTSSCDSMPSTPLDGPLSIKRTRTTPVPAVEPAPTPKKDPNPIRVAGARLMRKSKDGAIGFLDVFTKVYNVKLPIDQYWASAIPLGQMICEMGIEEARIRSALAWYSSHHEDEYVPQFTSAYQFKEKFFRIEKAMKRDSTNGNGRRHFCAEGHDVDWDAVSKFSREKRRS